MSAVEEFRNHPPDARGGFAVEVKFDRLVGRTGKMDPGDDTRALKFGDNQPTFLFPDKGMGARKAVVVISAPVVAGNAADLDAGPHSRKEVDPPKRLWPDDLAWSLRRVLGTGTRYDESEDSREYRNNPGWD